MTFPAKSLGFISRGVFCGLATPDVKSPLVFIYLASIPWGGLKIPATTCKSWNPSLPALDVLLHDSTEEVLHAVPSLHGPHPGKWLKEALPSSSAHPFGWAGTTSWEQEAAEVLYPVEGGNRRE